MLGLTTQQIEQLLKLLAASSNSSSVSHLEETHEEIDYSVTGTSICFHAKKEAIDWVIDMGLTDHMASLPKYLHEITSNNATSYTKLPNGTKMPITCNGNEHLCNGLVLKETFVVPTFKYNVLLVSKMCRQQLYSNIS